MLQKENLIMRSEHEHIEIEPHIQNHEGEDGDLSMRARAKAKTRDKIIASARYLFSQNGYQRATLRDIAEHAGLSTGAVFANFRDKQDIFNQILFEEMLLLKKALNESFDPSLSFKERGLKQFRVGCLHGMKNRGIFQSALEIFMTTQIDSQPVVDQLYQMILGTIMGLYKRAVQTKEIIVTDDFDSLVLLVHDLTITCLRRVFLVHGDVEREASLLGHYIELLLTGIGPSESET